MDKETILYLIVIGGFLITVYTTATKWVSSIKQTTVESTKRWDRIETKIDGLACEIKEIIPRVEGVERRLNNHIETTHCANDDEAFKMMVTLLREILENVKKHYNHAQPKKKGGK